MTNVTRGLGLAVALALSGGAAGAQSLAGSDEYMRACASCHGLTGHGDGMLSDYLTVEVPDLTRIRARNDGIFPVLQMMHVIDGSTGLRAHGSPMPIWGDRFEATAAMRAGDLGAEIEVRGRLQALIAHLEAIQE